MNSSLELLKNALVRRAASAVVSPQAEEICRIIDHFNSQHWHDRNRYDEQIKALEAKLAKLDKASHGE
jgi:hypothetical protein